jgi:hypothetical protein
LYSQFNFKPDPNQETFGINITGRHPVIVYNPNFVNAMAIEYLEMIMVHTGFKVLLRHCTSRLKDPEQIAALASNIAIDELIYQNTLNFLSNDSSLKDLVPTAQMFKLPEKDCFEEYFRQLFERQQQINKMIKMIWDSMTNEEKDKIINQSNNQEQSQQSTSDKQEQQEQKAPAPAPEPEPEPESNPELEPKSNSEPEPEPKQDPEPEPEHKPEPNSESESNPEPEPEPKPEPDQGPNNKFKEYNNTNDCIKDYFDPNGTSNIGWGTNDMFDADIKNYIEKNKDRVKAWGKHTGSAIEEILAANEPKISYKEVIRRFRKSVDTYARVNSRLKVNRRYDLAFPGHRRFLKTRIIFAVDCSGSMSNDDLAEGFAVINKILKHAEVIFVMFDTEIKFVETKLKKAKKTFKAYGRGGTDFNEVLQYADEIKCDGIVIFTDGLASVPKQPKAKVLWLTHSKNYEPPVSWGFVAHLDRFENNHIW